MKVTGSRPIRLVNTSVLSRSQRDEINAYPSRRNEIVLSKCALLIMFPPPSFECVSATLREGEYDHKHAAFLCVRPCTPRCPWLVERFLFLCRNQKSSGATIDRKSTRLNSSHVAISY